MNDSSVKPAGKRQNLLFFGLLAIPACFAPLSIDLLVPSLPAIASSLTANLSDTQLTIYTFILAYGLAPFFWGALSDKYGRKPLLLLGMALYMLITIACAFAQNIESLAALRFGQGFAAASGIVIARAMLRDRYGASGTTKAIATLYMFLAVLPVLIPIAGGYLAAFLSWQDLFFIMFAVAALALAGVAFFIRETMIKDRPTGNKESDAKKTLGSSVAVSTVLRHRLFLQSALTNMFAMSATVLFVTNYSFLATEFFAASAKENGYMLAYFNLTLAAGIYVVRVIVPFWGVDSSMRAAVGALLLGWLITAILCASSLPAIAALMPALLLASFGHGIIMALSPGQALIPFSVGAGTASAIYGCIQSVGASVLSYGVALLVAKNLANVSQAILLCAVLSALCFWFLMAKKPAI